MLPSMKRVFVVWQFTSLLFYSCSSLATVSSTASVQVEEDVASDEYTISFTTPNIRVPGVSCLRKFNARELTFSSTRIMLSCACQQKSLWHGIQVTLVCMNLVPSSDISIYTSFSLQWTSQHTPSKRSLVTSSS